MSAVAIVRCQDYHQEEVLSAVRQAVNLLGGIGTMVKPGQPVLVKPNLAGPFPPERSVTSHPAVVGAVVRLIQEAGGKPILFDSPAGVHTGPYLRSVYHRTGMEQLARETGAELCLDTEVKEIKVSDGRVMKHFTLVRPLADAELIINVPKLKAHLYTTLTGAVKNFYGAVPGVMKVAYHSKFPEVETFSGLLVDLFQYFQPRVALHLVDGVVAMEGNGPSWGRSRPVGLIVAGQDGFAVDWTLCRLIGLNPALVPTLNKIPFAIPEIRGGEIERFFKRDFRKAAANTVTDGLIALRWVPQRLRGRFGHYLLPKPQVIGEECQGCGVCVASCPRQAIRLVEKKARIDAHICVRCWCCNEVCHHGAVKLRQSFLGRLLTKI